MAQGLWNQGCFQTRISEVIFLSLQKGVSVSDTVIGQGNTMAWKLCSLDKNTCLTVFFDISSSERASSPGSQLYLQFLTRCTDFCLKNSHLSFIFMKYILNFIRKSYLIVIVFDILAVIRPQMVKQCFG